MNFKGISLKTLFQFEELDYPRFFSTFKLPERRGLAVTGNKSLERLTSNIITKYIREEPYVQMEQPVRFGVV